jgi:ATP-binding cassette subfamily B protein
LPLHTLRQAVAVVPQDTVLFDASIGYNIGFGKAGSTLQEIEQAAKLAHLHDFIMSLPEKYETRVGERGVKLSGGERQRIAIARVALRRPQIYIFDEATSSLDSVTERQVLRSFAEVTRSRTTIVIAHRLTTVMNADEIIVMKSGVVAEQGTHAALLERAGIYASAWHTQQHSQHLSQSWTES